MYQYQRQSSDQTLREGLTEYRKVFAKQIGHRQMSTSAEEFFEFHDIVHVVFGCDISLADEVVVKITSIFGTTAGFSVLRGYRFPESKETYESIRLRQIGRTALNSIVSVPKSIVRCISMTKKWPWGRAEAHMNTPLCSIREEFGIRVCHHQAK